MTARNLRLAKLSAMLVLAFCSSVTANAQGKNFIDQPYLEVVGSADTLVTPNEIYLRIVLAERDSRDRIPMEQLEAKMVDALKQIGIDPNKALSTSDFASNFKSYVFRGNEVNKSKTYSLKVSDAITATKVLIALEQLGISNTSVERVDHSELTALRLLVRSKAMENAKARAIALTKPLGQSVGAAIHIVDNFDNLLQGKALGVQVKLKGANSITPNYDNLPNIEFEKISVGVSVNVKFVLKP